MTCHGQIRRVPKHGGRAPNIVPKAKPPATSWWCEPQDRATFNDRAAVEAKRMAGIEHREPMPSGQKICACGSSLAVSSR